MTAREGGRCHRPEINMVGRDTVEGRGEKKGVAACWRIDGSWMKGLEGTSAGC